MTLVLPFRKVEIEAGQEVSIDCEPVPYGAFRAVWLLPDRIVIDTHGGMLAVHSITIDDEPLLELTAPIPSAVFAPIAMGMPSFAPIICMPGHPVRVKLSNAAGNPTVQVAAALFGHEVRRPKYL